MRDRTVPKSLDVQRTNAKMLPGAKDRTRRLRSTIFSDDGATKPNAVLDALFEPQEFNCREVAHGDFVGRVSFGGVSVSLHGSAPLLSRIGDGSVPLCRQYSAGAWIAG